MKLDNLLAPYLYQHKKLNLPGIGTFEADSSTIVPEDNDKHHTPVQGITFKPDSNPEPDDELIEYIKIHTGKMKPLAMADLESYLMLVKQFLNIGKPFYIEGIGTLLKTDNSTLKFTPGEYTTSRPESSLQEQTTGTKRKVHSEKKESSPEKSASGKVLLVLTTLVTIALIGWGGYYLYEINANKEKEEPSSVNAIVPTPDTSPISKTIQPDPSMLVKDSSARDTTAVQPAPLSTPAGNYKFVFETTANKERAIYRYNYLHKFNTQLQLQAKADSSLFKIYVVLPASSSDTTRIKDSLNAWYYGKKEMRVKIEQ